MKTVHIIVNDQPVSCLARRTTKAMAIEWFIGKGQDSKQFTVSWQGKTVGREMQDWSEVRLFEGMSFTIVANADNTTKEP